MSLDVDLDRPPVTAPAAPARRVRSLDLLIGAGLAVGLLAVGGVTGAAVRRAPHVGARPTVMVQAEGERPTIVTTFADGTRSDSDRALYAPWRPDRDAVMIVVIAGQQCSIVVDGALYVSEVASGQRLAVCVWTAAHQ